MFRAFSFVLALVLCTSVWSTARAAPNPETFGPVVKPFSAAIFGKEAAVHRNGPYKTDSPLQSVKDGLHSVAAVVTDAKTIGTALQTIAAAVPFSAWVYDHWWLTFENFVERTFSSSGNKSPKDAPYDADRDRPY